MRRPYRGITYVEVLVSAVILGAAVAGGLQALGHFAHGSASWEARSIANELAADLMAQIDALPFEDPSGSAGIGVESGEVSGDRSTFDDVDDFHGWTASPPRNRANQELTAYGDFRTAVEVAYDDTVISPLGVTVPAGSIKRITVTVCRRRGAEWQPLQTLTLLRTRHATP